MRDVATAKINYYAGQRPDLILGENEYRDHDATQSWSDGGQGVQLFDELIERALAPVRQQIADEMSSYGSNQVKQAVLDYVGNGYGDIANIDGKIHFVFDASSKAATFRACWALQDMILNAIQAAEQAGDVETLQAMQQMIGTLSQNFRAPVVAAPVRPAPGRVGGNAAPVKGRLGQRPR